MQMWNGINLNDKATVDMYMIKFISQSDKEMASGMRNISREPLTDEEIEYIKLEIDRIEANVDDFIFNDEEHLLEGTCYNYTKDKVFVAKNVFPDTEYGSTHPRDVMSVAAVLAHEYYGHRTYRQEYLNDNADYETTPYWQDECRASITAAKITPNLTRQEQKDLIMDAIYRAKECNQLIEMDDYMKEVVYGYGNHERNISRAVTPIRFVSEESKTGAQELRDNNSKMPKVRCITRDDDEYERQQAHCIV